MRERLAAFGLAMAVLASAGPAPAAEYLWQTNSGSGDVHVIDAQTLEVVARIEVGPDPHGIAAPADFATVYLSIEANGQPRGELVAVDPTTFRIERRIQVCREPHALAVTPDGRWLYLPCRDGTYQVRAAATLDLVATIETGGRPHNTTAAPDGRRVYLSPMGSPARVTIVAVDAGHRVAGEIPFSGSVRPAALAFRHDLFFQHVDGLNGFQVARIGDRRVVATVRHPRSLGWLGLGHGLGWFDGRGLHRCHGVAVRPGEAEVWSVCGRWVSVHALDGKAFAERQFVELADNGYWITFDPSGARAFVALPGVDQVAVVDAASGRIDGYVAVGDAPKRNLVVRLPDR